MASIDLQSEQNWDLYEATLLIAKNIKECKGWTKREPTIEQHPKRYDDELAVLRITITFQSWLRRFVDIIYSGIYNGDTCGLCRNCLFPSRLIRMLIKSLQSYNRICIEDFFDDDCFDIDILRNTLETDFKNGDNMKSKIVENVVRMVVDNEFEQRCCQHNDDKQEVDHALTKVLEDNIDYILDMIVSLVVANTYHTTPGRTYDPYATMAKYEYDDYFAPEEAGLVIAHRMFDVLEKMTRQAKDLLTNKRNEKMLKSN